jgi:hypothetical protein
VSALETKIWVNCFQFCFNFASILLQFCFEFELAPLQRGSSSSLHIEGSGLHGRAVQVEGIKTWFESAYGCSA